MSDLIVVGLKIGFLVLLWLFILFTGNVVRTDLFGRKVPAAEAAELVGQPATAPAPLSSKQRRADKKRPKSLIVTHGTHAGESTPLADAVLIGRAADCQLRLDDDDYVSTRHARIARGPDGYVLEDLGSTNGTFVNNHRISSPTPIAIGDTVRIGRTLMGLEN